MRTRDAISIVLGAGLLLLIAVFASRIVDHYQSTMPGGRIELGRVKVMQLDEATQQQLAALEQDVFITYYVSARAQLPSNMRRMERDITDLLQTMKQASGGRLDFQIVDPHAREDFVRYAAHQRIAPFRARSVARDSYTERTVWSSLHIAYGAHEAAVVNGVSPEHVPRLQSIIMGQLAQKDQPRRPVFGIAAASAYQDLTYWLRQHGEVVEIDMTTAREIPLDVDVLFWMDPRQVSAPVIRRVQRFLESGRSVIMAGSAHTVVQSERSMLELRPTGYDASTLLAPFGLRPIDGLVLDQFSESVPGHEAPMPARFRVRCIPPNQDFRQMHSLPNGHLFFDAPTPMTIDAEVLAEQGLHATVLATTSDRTKLSEINYGEVDLTRTEFHEGDAVPKLPLMIWLRPNELWQGSMVVCASSSLFRDGAFVAQGYAHRRLVDVLVQTLASDERLVIHRAGLQRTEPLPPMTASQRTFWRAACIVLIPVVLIMLAWRRGLVQLVPGRAFAQQRWQWRLIAQGALGVLCIALLIWLLPRWQLDLTADGTNRLSPATRTIAQESREGMQVTVLFSRANQLPPELRPMMRQLRTTLGQLQRTGAGLQVQWVTPEDLSSADRDALHEQGITPMRVTSRDEDMTIVRSVYSTVMLQGNGRTELLHFPDRASFDHVEFRMAFALWRLHTGRDVHIAFAADVPRLTAAEAYQDFQRQSLLPPSGTDVYALARAGLRQAGFRVTHVNPYSPEVPDDVDLIVWMQPRRDILPMLQTTVEHLHRGVPAIIAAQHFNMQARQFRGDEFTMVYWPQPQVTDIDMHYLPDLGLELVHEVIFDELLAPMQLQTQINRARGERDYEPQASALPFLVRVVAANFAPHPITRNLGDQFMPFAAYWRLSEEQLEAHGLTATPLMYSSTRSWSYDWTGGWIPAPLLNAPPLDADGQPQWLGRKPLMVLVQGSFPLPAEPLTERRIDSDAPVAMADDVGQTSQLLLLGSSELFKNDHYGDDTFRSDHLLLHAASVLALDEQLASVATHRQSSRGFDYVQAEQRMRWRIIVLIAGPISVLLFGVGWGIVRQRRSHSFSSAGDQR
jgi:hypothetical protein